MYRLHVNRGAGGHGATAAIMLPKGSDEAACASDTDCRFGRCDVVLVRRSDMVSGDRAASRWACDRCRALPVRGSSVRVHLGGDVSNPLLLFPAGDTGTDAAAGPPRRRVAARRRGRDRSSAAVGRPVGPAVARMLRQARMVAGGGGGARTAYTSRYVSDHLAQRRACDAPAIDFGVARPDAPRSSSPAPGLISFHRPVSLV